MRYEWELLGAANRKGEMPFIGWAFTDSLDPAEACKAARHVNPGTAFIKLADGQGRKVIFLNVDEVLANAA